MTDITERLRNTPNLPYMKPVKRVPVSKATGWHHEMLQDVCRELSIWLSNRIDSRRHAREAAEQIKEKYEQRKTYP